MSKKSRNRTAGQEGLEEHACGDIAGRLRKRTSIPSVVGSEPRTHSETDLGNCLVNITNGCLVHVGDIGHEVSDVSLCTSGTRQRSCDCAQSVARGTDLRVRVLLLDIKVSQHGVDAFQDTWLVEMDVEQSSHALVQDRAQRYLGEVDSSLC